MVKEVLFICIYQNIKKGRESKAKMIKILIADDFPILVEDMKEAIEKNNNMKVIGTANSGQEIVELAKQKEYDIILMDIEMEHMSAGIEATKRIRDEDPHAKIIFLTAHGTDEIILQAMATGAIDYIIKGKSNEKLIEHIKSAYNGESLMGKEVKDIIIREYSRLKESEENLVIFINNLSKLTKAEREIIHLLLQKKKVKEIAEIRSVELVTVKTQISAILKKFNEKRTKNIVKKINELQLSHLFADEILKTD